VTAAQIDAIPTVGKWGSLQVVLSVSEQLLPVMFMVQGKGQIQCPGSWNLKPVMVIYLMGSCRAKRLMSSRGRDSYMWKGWSRLRSALGATFSTPALDSAADSA